MKILHITDTYLPKVGGIETMVEQLATRQRAAGHQVRVLTRRTGAESPGVCRSALELWRLLEDAEVVHAHVSLCSPLAIAGARGAARRGLPTIASVHSLWSGGPWNANEQAAAVASALGGLRGLPIIWAPVSEVAAGSVRRALGPRARVVVLPNAVDLEFWADCQPCPVPRPFTLASVGRLAARKRPLAIVEMLHEVRGRIDPAVPLHAVLGGVGSLAPQVQRRLAQLGMNWVEMPGTLTAPQVRELYRRSDVFIAASRLESFGLAALEARTAGLTLAALAGTGVADFAGPGAVLARDDAGLVDGLVELVRCATATRPDGLVTARRAPAEASSPYCWQGLLAGAEQLYGQAAALQRVRPAAALQAAGALR